MRKLDPEKIAGDHPFIPEMVQTVRIPITLRRYVQPAVNCQPSYCWGDSQSKPREHKNLESDMTISRRCVGQGMLWPKCMEGNAALHVARYNHDTRQLS